MRRRYPFKKSYSENLDKTTLKILEKYPQLDKNISGASIQKLIKLSSQKDQTEEWFHNIFKLFEDQNNYEQKLVIFASLLDNSGSAKDILDKFLKDNPFKDFLIKVLDFEYLSDILTKCPDILLKDSLFKYSSKSRNDFKSEIRQAYTEIEKNKYCKAESNIFFNYKRKEEFRIAINELFYSSCPYEAEKELSELFEAIFEFVFELAFDCMKKNYGLLKNGCFSILALNSLASNELVYEDSISILFLYQVATYEDDDNAKSMGGKISLKIHEYYTILANDIIESLLSKDGSIYNLSYPKVSEKSLKPRVFKFDEYLTYIQKNENLTKRFNLLNIKALAGDNSFSNDIIQSLSPYVYKKYFSISDIAEIKHLLSQYTTQAKQKPLLNIQFMTQLYHFFHSSNYKSFKNIRNGIDGLLENNIISKEEHSKLTKSSTIFKRIFHIEKLLKKKELSIYSLDDINIDTILNDKVFKDIKEFIKNYDKYNHEIQLIFKDHFNKLISKNDNDTLLYSLIEKNEEAKQYLETFAFEDLNKALFLFNELIPSAAKGKEKFATLLPVLIGELSRSADPDLLLMNLVKVVQSYNAKESFIELLSNDTVILHTLSKLFSNSPYLTEILIHYPELFEKLNDTHFFLQKNSKLALKKRLQHFLKIFPFEEAVRLFKNYATFRIGLKNLHGSSDLIQTLGELSNLAEIILYQSVLYFKNKIEAEKNIDAGPISIILLGKLGGRELNIGSDLDIIFIYNEEKELLDSYFTSQFWTDVISLLTGFFNKSGSLGILYEIDLKLRPDGRNAPLCHSIQKFEDYLLKKGAVWEKLVYTKARVLSNNLKFKIQTKRIISKFVFSDFDYHSLKNEIKSMRKRILVNAQKKSAAKYLFKKGKGGLLDLEFLAEFLIIYHGRKKPELRKKNIFNMYHALKKYEIIDKEDYNIAVRALIFLRKIEMILRIMNNMSYDKLPDNPVELSKLANKMKMRHEDLLLNEYHIISNQVSELYKKYFD